MAHEDKEASYQRNVKRHFDFIGGRLSENERKLYANELRDHKSELYKDLMLMFDAIESVSHIDKSTDDSRSFDQQGKLKELRGQAKKRNISNKE